MSTFKFLVEVETEREQGKFASRDEQAEAIISAIETGAGDAELSGLGVDSNSDYAVTLTEVTELDNKELKALWKENESRVASEIPGDPALRKRIKELNAEKVQIQRELDNLRSRIENMRTLNEEHNGSRISIRDWSTEIPTYVADDKPLMFKVAEHEEIQVKIVEDGLELTYQGFRGLAMMPQASNVLVVKAADR